MSTPLTALIRDAILSAINDGSIERDNVTQIAVGPSPDFQVLCLWASERWEDYEEYEADDAVAEISNAAWLDTIDNLGDAPVEVAEPTGYRSKRGELDLGDRQEAYLAALEQLRAQIQNALRELAVSDELGEFPRVVGLMEYGMSVSGYADLVAFRHPLGAGTILPIHETRAGDIDIYQFGVLHDDGVTMFYPEGEGDSLEDDDRPSTWRTYAFADMESWRPGGRHDGDIFLRMKGDLHDIRFTNGHDHDEWGGPGREDILAALREHFARHPELTFDPTRMPHPDDSALFERWMTTYNQQNCGTGRAVVRNACDDFGEAAARQFLDRQSPDAEDRAFSIATLADRLFADHQFEKALELITLLEGKARMYEWREEMQSLLLLRRYQDALERADVIAAADDNKRASDVLPFRAMSLAGLGRPAEAAALLEGVEDEKRDEEVHFADAFLNRQMDPERARTALIRSLNRSSRFADLGTLYLEDSPPLLEILDERAHIQRQRENHDARIAEIVEKVSPEIVPLEVVDAATAGLSSGPVGEPEQWRVLATIERDRDEKGSYKKLVRVAHSKGIAWVPTQTGGLTGFDLSDTERPRLAHHIPSETSLEDACRAGKWLFAADYKLGLTVIDLDAQQIVAHPTRLFDDSLSAIAIGDGFVAVVGNKGAEIYDIEDPTRPELLSVVGSGYSSKAFQSAHGEDVAISGSFLFMAAGHAGLVVADVTDRKNPEIVAALARGDSEFWADTVDIFANIAVLTRGHEAWFVDVTNPTRPRSLCVLGSEERKPQLRALAVDASGNRLVGCDENLPIIWTIELDDDGRPAELIAHPTVNAEGEPDRFFYYRDAQLLPNGRLAVLTGSELMVLERQSATEPLGDVTAPMRAAEEPLRNWVLERLRQHAEEHADQPIGVLVLSLVYTNLELGLEPPRSIAGIDAGPIREHDDSEPEVYEVELGEVVELPAEPEEGEHDDPLGLVEKRKAGAWVETVDAVLRSLAEEPLLRDHAAGRLYLVRRAYDPRRDRADMRVVDILVDGSKPWQPYRRAVAGRAPRTLEQKLEEYGSIDKYEKGAREDPALRAELFELAAGGNGAALRVIWSLRDLEEEAVLRAFLTAAGTGGLSQLVISGLAHFNDRDEVVEVLERIFESPPELKGGSHFTPGPLQLKVAAAAALERTNDDAILEVVRGLLDDPEGDYRHADLAIEALEAMDSRMHLVLPSLRGWVERAGENDNRLPGICRQLFRAGHWELPEKLLPQSAREKSSEQYATVKLGIKGLGEIPQHEACAAERLFTSRMLVDRVVDLRKRDDRESTVWPPELPLEPWPGSWRFVLERALPALRLYGELDHFVELLRAHALPDERYVADRALLLAMADYYENTKQHDEWRRIAEAILAVPEAFEGAPLRSMQKRNRLLRLQEGWDLLQARDLAAARVIADQAMTDEPDDGQVLFFDARLAWLEADSPEACVERAKQHLEKLGHDPAGRGRLLNVIGCALDELGRVNDALPYFERAAQAHAEEPLYLANIAECYEKLGRMDQAIHWAREALNRGAKSELCERLANQ